MTLLCATYSALEPKNLAVVGDSIHWLQCCFLIYQGKSSCGSSPFTSPLNCHKASSTTLSIIHGASFHCLNLEVIACKL